MALATTIILFEELYIYIFSIRDIPTAYFIIQNYNDVGDRIVQGTGRQTCNFIARFQVGHCNSQ